MTGTNAYAVISSPRNSGAEAMVISAPWLSRIDEGAGTINIRGISTVLALAGFLKRTCVVFSSIVIYIQSTIGYSYWGKDIILVLSDGYLDGMQAWLGDYHRSPQSGSTLYFAAGVTCTDVL